MIATLLAAMLIPPPPGWTPPHFTGPGLLCANRYGLDPPAGESATVDWPGEIFINDLFSTFRIATPRGEVVITENGPRTRPDGRWRRAGRSGTHVIRDHGGGVYSVEVGASGNIRAVTLRFPSGFGTAGQRALLARLRIEAPASPACLRPDNRP
jgi:hypothetical protein